MASLSHDEIHLPYAPKFLQDVPHWICWRKEERSGRWTKVPYNPLTGEHARTNDPTTWCEYRDARCAWERDLERYNGLGFVFHGDFTGIDLDHCVAADGTIADWARAYVERLNTYTERSPNDGLHLYVTGTIPKGLRRRIPDAPHPEAALEMYCSGRYFTVTGRYLQGTPLTAETRGRELLEIYTELCGSHNVLHDRQTLCLTSQDAMTRVALEATQPALFKAQDAMTRASLDAHPAETSSTQQAMVRAALDATQPALFKMQEVMTHAAALQAKRAESRPPQLPVPENTAGLSDRELVRHAAKAANGAAFKALWRGDTTGYPSRSEAELALCGYLAFWTGGDAVRVDRLFRHSCLYESATWERPARAGLTYGQCIVARACTDATRVPGPFEQPALQTGIPTQAVEAATHAPLQADASSTPLATPTTDAASLHSAEVTQAGVGAQEAAPIGGEQPVQSSVPGLEATPISASLPVSDEIDGEAARTVETEVVPVVPSVTAEVSPASVGVALEVLPEIGRAHV